MTSDRALIACIGIAGVTALGVTYFIFVRQDGSVLLSLASVIGGIVGYVTGKKSK
jgi:hypothetical protein